MIKLELTGDEALVAALLIRASADHMALSTDPHLRSAISKIDALLDEYYGETND